MKFGKSYHLAEQMDDEISCTVALLHDVAEDTSVTISELKEQFPEDVVEALRLLTHDDGTEYFDYVKRLKKNPIAKKVKLEDLKHNADETRNAGGNIPKDKLEYWRKKYAKAREILLS